MTFFQNSQQNRPQKRSPSPLPSSASQSSASQARKSYGTFKPLSIRRLDGSSTPIGDVLKTASESMGLAKKAQEWSVCQLWEAIAEPFRQMTRAQKISYHGHQTVLDIQVSDTVTASMLQYQLPQLMTQLNHFAPQTGLTVDKIALHVVSNAKS